jgi:hypothetical protein
MPGDRLVDATAGLERVPFLAVVGNIQATAYPVSDSKLVCG